MSVIRKSIREQSLPLLIDRVRGLSEKVVQLRILVGNIIFAMTFRCHVLLDSLAGTSLCATIYAFVALEDKQMYESEQGFYVHEQVC